MLKNNIKLATILKFLSPRDNCRGSMLMNLLVGIGIMVLMLSFSIPYLRQYQPNLQLSSVARDLSSNLRYAQQLTITEQNVHIIELNMITNSYEIIRLTPATTTLSTVYLPAEVSFNSISGFTNNQIRYNAYGGVSENGDIVLINTNSLTKTITVKPSGYVQTD